MKKIKFYILTIIITFVITPNISFASSIEKISMDITILENGTAQVTEHWNAYPTQGTEVYKPYFNLGNSEIKNFTVSENGKEYTNIGSWNSNSSFEEKAYRSGINKTSDGLELCWGMSSYKNHIYKLDYFITNFVKGYNDSDLIYFTLLNPELSPLPKSVEVNITTKNQFPEETLIWGYGWENGKAAFENGKLVFDTSGGFNSNDYITILVKMPAGTFAVEEHINEEFETIFIKAEENRDKEPEKTTVLSFLLNLIVFIFYMFLLVLPFVVTIYVTKVFNIKKVKIEKELPRKKDINYFREIPCNKDLFYAYWLGKTYSFIKQKENVLGAILLKWIQNDHIRVIKNTKGIFKRETNAIDFTKDFVVENDLEKELKRMLVVAAGKNKILEEKEFGKWAGKNYEDINEWFKKIYEDNTQKLISKNLVVEKEKKYLGIAKYKKNFTTTQTNEEAIKLLGLKKYLEDYSSIDEKKTIEVKLWNEYLIFAQVLGIADKVAKEFDKVYPNYVQDMNMSYTMSDLIIINHITRSGITSANRAYNDRMSSGGGGFSSGGGGGGSFGGGGSGGGFR